MKNRFFIPAFFLLILGFSSWILFSNYENWEIEKIFTFLKDFLEIISPIVIFILSYFGLRTWQDELIGKRNLKIVEELFSAFNNFVFEFKTIRNSWPYTNLIPSRENQRKDIDIYYGFNLNEVNEKINNADKYKDLLINKIDEAERILGKKILPSIQELLTLYDHYCLATSDIYLFNQQGEDGGKFSIDSIMKMETLQLVANYRYPIKGVSVEQLNKLFNDRLEKSVQTFRKCINKLFN